MLTIVKVVVPSCKIPAAPFEGFLVVVGAPPGATVVVTPGARVVVTPGARVVVTPGARVVATPGAKVVVTGPTEF